MASSGSPLRLALLGYGKMGRTIAQLAAQRGFEIGLKLDIEENRDGAGITADNFRGIDVAIDFTTPSVVVENIRRIAALKCNLVVGTTGWHDRLDEVRKAIDSSAIGMVYAPNFSIGVQIFYRLARAAAASFREFAMYEPYITETHHSAKEDAPSGTALELKRVVDAQLPGQPVPISSVRAGYSPGIHELGFDSEADTVIIRHTARSRQGFAEGALLAARWVVGKKGLFTFDDVIGGSVSSGTSGTSGASKEGGLR